MEKKLLEVGRIYSSHHENPKTYVLLHVDSEFVILEELRTDPAIRGEQTAPTWNMFIEKFTPQEQMLSNEELVNYMNDDPNPFSVIKPGVYKLIKNLDYPRFKTNILYEGDIIHITEVDCYKSHFNTYHWFLSLYYEKFGDSEIHHTLIAKGTLLYCIKEFRETFSPMINQDYPSL